MFYVTKYALTEGIWEVDPANVYNKDDNYIYLRRGKGMGIQVTRTDWFRTKEEAVTRVQQLVEAKRRSLERSIQKLDNLDPQSSKPW